ncbi:Hypothetical predicted protein, partial [Mytilus galloprovincialis]
MSRWAYHTLCSFKTTQRTVERNKNKVFLENGYDVKFDELQELIETDTEIETTNVSFTKNKRRITTDSMKYLIKSASEKDEGLYIYTFGPNNMQLKFDVIVV